MKRNLLIVLCLLLASAAMSQTTYYWVGGTTATNISGAAPWNTKLDGTGASRSAVAATDVLVVDGTNIGGATATTGVASIVVNAATTAQMKIINGAAVVLLRASSGGMITFANNTSGEDGLLIDASSSVEQATPGGTYLGYVYLDFPAGVTGKIAGKLKMSNGTAHRTTCRTVGGLVVTNGGSIQYNTSAYPFGNTTTGTPGTSNSVNGAVVIQSGGSLIAESATSPFGGSSTSSIVDCRAGSHFYVRTTFTTGSVTALKTFGNLYIQNNASFTMDAASFNKIENLTIDAGSVFNVGTTTGNGGSQISVTGNLLVNGVLNGTPETTGNNSLGTLIMGGSSPQTISGSGSVTLGGLTVGNSSQVTLQKDITVNGPANVFGKLNLNTWRLNGTGSFTSRVAFAPTTTTAVATLTAGSFQILVPTSPSLSSLPGLTISGAGIPEHTNIISYSSGNGQINLSQAVTASASNVTISFSSDTATLQTASINGFGANGAINLSGTQSFNAGTNYIIDAATANPVGITTGSNASAISIGSLLLNADAVTNNNLRLSGGLYLNQGRLRIRSTDTVRVAGIALTNNLGTVGRVITEADLVSGAKGVLRYDGVSSATLIPLGTATSYLPVIITPANGASGDYCVSVAEGIAGNATVNGSSLPAASLNNTVKATWYMNRLNGVGANAANLSLGWPAALEGSVFSTAATSGIVLHDGTEWPATVTGNGVIANKSVTADFTGLSGAQAFSIWLKKQDQTLSFTALPAVTYGDNPVTPVVSSSNTGNDLTYSSNNTAVATISNGKINIVGAGNATITAFQAGNSLYNEATPVTRELVVAKAPLTVTAEDKTREKGQPDPVFTAIYDGFVHNETAAVFTTPVSFTTDAVLNSPAGVYNIIPAGIGAANYTLTYANGKLTVTAPNLLNQTISFPAITPVTYGVADLASVATSDNSTIAITYSSNNTAVATIVDGKIHVVGIGEAVITASQAGNDTYNPAVDKAQTLTVQAAPLVIKADNKTRNQGAANPTFTFTYTGFVNGETSAVLSTLPKATTSASTASAPGTYDIVVSDATAANYLVSFQKGTLTVNAFLQQIITFPVIPAKTYGAADFSAGAASNNSTIPVTYTSSNTGVATVTNGVIHIVSAGTTTITASQAGSTNYGEAANVAQLLTINKAALNIKADDQSKYTGQVNPALTTTVTGYVNNETSQVFTTQPVVTTTAVTASPAGTYDINVSGAVAANYTITYQKGTLTVRPLVTQTISFGALAGKTYGDADFNPGVSSSNTTIPVTLTSSNTAVATIVANMIHIVGAGTTVITAAQAGDQMYVAATSVAQTLNVAKAVVTITADAKTKTEGQANPALTANYSGLVNGESPTVFTTAPALATTVGATTVAGNYAITVDGAAAANYTFVYVPGLLTVYSRDGVETAALEVLGNKMNLQARVYVTVPVIGAVQLFDSYGNLYYSKKVYLPKGFTNVVIPAGAVKPGVYILTVTGNNLKLSKRIGLM